MKKSTYPNTPHGSSSNLDFLQLFVIKDGANFMGHVIKSSTSHTTQFRKMGIIFQVAFQGSSLLFSPYLLLLLFTLDIKISGKDRSKKCSYPLKQEKIQNLSVWLLREHLQVQGVTLVTLSSLWTNMWKCVWHFSQFFSKIR